MAPAIACEIGSQHVAAARAAHGMLAMHSVRRLNPGAVSPNLSGMNISQAESVRRSVSEALSAVGGQGRHRDVIAILPDAAVRVLLLDFDALPSDSAEAAAIIRFRLKKSLPFDVEHCALSYQRLQSNGAVKTVVALCPAMVLAEYEQVFRDGGYEPGVVLPSVLATLGMLDADRAAMLVKVDHETTSIALADSSGLRLLRTLEHPSGNRSLQELLNAVHASLIFYEDSTGHPVSQVYVSGPHADPSLISTLSQENEAGVRELSAGTGDTRFLTAVEGALLQ